MFKGLCCALLLCICTEMSRAGDEVLIQQALDEFKHYRLEPNRTYNLDFSIQLGPGQTLEGCGYSTVLNYRGPGGIAILYGAINFESSNYGCYLMNLAVRGGGVHVRRFGQHCGIDKVWVIDAPQAGFLVEGAGDRFLIRDCVAWACGTGFLIRTTYSVNGLILEHCNAQACDGPGLVCETFGSFPAHLSEMVIRDFTCQGNCRATSEGAEIILRGAVAECRIQHAYIECVDAVTAIRCEPQYFPDRPAPRVPINLYIEQGTSISGHSTTTTSLELLRCERATINESRLSYPIRRTVVAAIPTQLGPHTVRVEVIPGD